jgi:putative endonuclease
MTYKSELGEFGENLACEYLVKKGYKIIGRNVRKPWGELDIIAKSPDKTLVFVEVKTMAGYLGAGLKPEDQLTKAKLKKLQKTASLYVGHYPEKIKDNQGWRIDLVAITMEDVDKQNPEINHYKNIS